MTAAFTNEEYERASAEAEELVRLMSIDLRAFKPKTGASWPGFRYGASFSAADSGSLDELLASNSLRIVVRADRRLVSRKRKSHDHRR